jgi:hypothetical protein
MVYGIIGNIQKYLIVGTVPNSNRKIVEEAKSIPLAQGGQRTSYIRVYFSTGRTTYVIHPGTF